MRPDLRWLLLLAVSACREPSAPAEEEAGDKPPKDDYQQPVFVDPASGVLTLDHDQLEDLALRVAETVPGRTQLQIDGMSVGTLLEPSALGQLEGSTLRLRLGGALVKGEHSLRLVTPGTVAPQVSAPVEVRIVSAGLPDLSYELGANEIVTGMHVAASGSDAAGLLLVTDADGAKDGVLHILRAEGAGWNPADLRSVELPDYVHVAEDDQAAVAAVVVDADPEDRVRVAWRVGRPGAGIDAIELEWGAAQNTLGPRREVARADGVGEAEWTAFERPAFVGSNLVFEAYSPADTEQPLPGDDTIFGARWPTDHAAPKDAQRLNFGPLVDLDQLSPALDLAADGDTRLGLRLDGITPSVIHWDPGSALPTLEGPPRTSKEPQLGNQPLGLATVLGAFGSRTTAAVYDGGSLRVVLTDASGPAGRRLANPSAASIPEEAPTGALAATVGLGSPLFLVPYGGAGSVRALLVDGDRTTVRALDDLFCDQVALPASSGGNEAGSMAFACLREGTLRIGALFVGK